MDIEQDLRTTTFGALSEAQQSLSTTHTANSRKRKRAEPTDSKLSSTDTEKVNKLREHLSSLKRLKEKPTDKSRSQPKTSVNNNIDNNDSEDEDHKSRPSKHAPPSQSSKHPVSRRRQIITDASLTNPFHSRDPRFTSAKDTDAAEADKLRKNYSFLTTYRTNELSALKTTLSTIQQRQKTRKSQTLTPSEEEEVERLKRGINSIENRIKSDDYKEREREMRQRHRREEREKIRKGKQPFFLRKSELKKRAEAERMGELKGRERVKVDERRKKREEMKERKRMPGDRRVVGEK